MKKLYIAVPYTINPEQAFRIANQYSARMMLAGNVVFSPISHSHPIAIQNELPESHEFWMKQDLPFVEWCDGLHVLCITGWETSRGVQEEIGYAKKLNKFVQYIKPDNLNL